MPHMFPARVEEAIGVQRRHVADGALVHVGAAPLIDCAARRRLLSAGRQSRTFEPRSEGRQSLQIVRQRADEVPQFEEWSERNATSIEREVRDVCTGSANT